MPRSRSSLSLRRRRKQARNGAAGGRRLNNQLVLREAGPPPQLTNAEVYRFMQFTTDGLVPQTQPTAQLVGYAFQASYVSQITSFTALFDQYMIEKIAVTFTPMYRANAVTVPANVLIPMIYTVVDYDDATTPGSLGVLQSYQNAQCHSDARPFTVTWVPSIAMAAYGSGVFTSYANRQRQWIDAASTAVPHYGLKVGITAGAAGQTNLQQWNIQTRYWMAWRNVR